MPSLCINEDWPASAWVLPSRLNLRVGPQSLQRVYNGQVYIYNTSGSIPIRWYQAIYDRKRSQKFSKASLLLPSSTSASMPSPTKNFSRPRLGAPRRGPWLSSRAMTVSVELSKSDSRLKKSLSTSEWRSTSSASYVQGISSRNILRRDPVHRVPFSFEGVDASGHYQGQQNHP